MILLPYLYRVTTVHQIPVHSYTILTIGGTTLWSEEEGDPMAILNANELYAESITHRSDVYLCSIDLQKTKVTDFYKWNEITDPDMFCWRTLYTFGEKQNWLPHPNECIGEYSYQMLCDMICNKDI
jgi:hypothetical protein